MTVLAQHCLSGHEKQVPAYEELANVVREAHRVVGAMPVSALANKHGDDLTALYGRLHSLKERL